MAFQQGDKVIILNPSKHAQETVQMTSYSTVLTQMSNRKRELEERLMTEQTEGLDASEANASLAEVEKEIMSL